MDNCSTYPRQQIVRFSKLPEDNITVCHFTDYAYIDLNTAGYIVQDRLDFNNGKDSLTLVFNPKRIAYSKTALKFILSKESRVGIKAMATVDHKYNLFKRLIQNLFLSLVIEIPFKIFKNEDSAKAWLKTQNE